ncbi:MAG TPA: DUF177 domain-containing protein [Polyangiaceae bacterium]|nr:DUF177 domain-containing protein [Polyangiaceae bacterium]
MATRGGAFVVPIHDLDVAGRDVRFVLTAAWLRGALEECELQPAGPEGELTAHLTKTGNEVLVQGQIDVALQIPCARCLQPVELRPHVELALLLVPAAAAHASKGAAHRRRPDARKPAAPPKDRDESDFSAEDAEEDVYEGDEVVLDRFVREAILLESPIFPLCSEACAGIRPASASATSAEAITDPRFLPLLELAKKKNMKE